VLVSFLFFLFFLFSGFLGAPNDIDVIAAGVVVDERGLPVTDASVTLLPPSVVTNTNVAGFFRTHFIDSGGSIGNFVLEVKKTGFKVARVNIVTGEHATLKIKLEAEDG